MRVGYNLTGAGAPVHLWSARITASALSILGVKPLHGRGFSASDELEPDQANVALLGHRLWQQRFGGRADVVGERIQLNGRAFTVVGVLPRVSALPGDIELLAPLGFSARDRLTYEGHWVEVYGRLRPGVTLAAAQAEQDAIAVRAAEARPASRGWGVKLVPLVEATVGPVRPVLLSLLGAVGFLLLIACANVANLLLARATARAREIAVRAALGASRARIVRQLLTESVLLALAAGALGLLLAESGLEALLSLAPEALPRAEAIGVDGRSLAFALALAAATGVGFGLAPAFQATRVDLQATLRQTGRGTSAGRARQRLRGALVVGQVAIALVLLAGAGLLMRSFVRLQGVDPGFNPRDAVMTGVFLPRASTPARPATLPSPSRAWTASPPSPAWRPWPWRATSPSPTPPRAASASRAARRRRACRSPTTPSSAPATSAPWASRSGAAAPSTLATPATRPGWPSSTRPSPASSSLARIPWASASASAVRGSARSWASLAT
jgi:putative ABC transport system permease protein